jgi:hypothetical protein
VPDTHESRLCLREFLMHLKRMTILKVKGVSPDRISAIHEEVRSLRDERRVRALLEKHPVLAVIKAKLEAECRARAESWKRGRLDRIASGYQDLETSTAHTETKAAWRRSQDALKVAIEAFQSEVIVSVEILPDSLGFISRVDPCDHPFAEILKSTMCDDELRDYYNLEIRIQASLEVKVTAQFSMHVEDRWVKPSVEKVVDGKLYELIPGEYLYGKLFELLGIKPADGDPDLSKILARK